MATSAAVTSILREGESGDIGLKQHVKDDTGDYRDSRPEQPAAPGRWRSRVAGHALEEEDHFRRIEIGGLEGAGAADNIETGVEAGAGGAKPAML